jgi:hypothetical protein
MMSMSNAQHRDEVQGLEGMLRAITRGGLTAPEGNAAMRKHEEGEERYPVTYRAERRYPFNLLLVLYFRSGWSVDIGYRPANLLAYTSVNTALSQVSLTTAKGCRHHPIGIVPDCE